MLTVVGWNVFFIGLNLCQIARVMVARNKEKRPRPTVAPVRVSAAAA